MAEGMAGLLVMAGGTVVRGEGFGARGVTTGELVFQTGVVGYQEALTDPSYGGQILIFTYPLVGNYGTGPLHSQSVCIHVRAAIMRHMMPSSGHRDSASDLDAMLREQGIPALAGVDTRFLTRQVREQGVVPAALAVGPEAELPPVEQLRALAESLDYDSIDFVAQCSTTDLIWRAPSRPEGPRIALIDYGAKAAMAARLQEMGAGVWIVPAKMPADEILRLQPDGILLSNGPGDPSRLDYAVNTVRTLVEQGERPVFGICLGHQLLGLASGATTSKMKFGHRGVNQPVLETATGRLSVTTQNHGYMVEPSSIPADYLVTHTNLNDGSVEGIAHRERPVWGVQWHPEAHPGPTDTQGIIDRFVTVVEAQRASA
ncbi:MAG TPA: glutamine-hydrolyzing carbamoyl-phosphate synthase small subunit [Chloroflexia bacterium]|nr:glutamine-hydrolyzing carbamoyl-phosphate synthase small subunit [Chloroflexia bacterium]